MWSRAAAIALLVAAAWLPAGPASAQASLERALVPLFGGDTDIGIGAGLIGSVARVDPALDPFRWKIEGAAFGTVKLEQGARPSAPFQDVFLVFARHGLFGDRLRLQLRPSFTRETNLRYFGLGNATRAPAEEIAARDHYTRTHPTVRAQARVKLLGALHLLVGGTYTYNWIDYQPESTLAADLARPDDSLQGLLQLDRRHAVLLLETSLALDTRDNEVAPTHGGYHEVGARLSPWQTADLPYRYANLSANLRWYLPLGTERLILATRLVGDILLGDPPVYELARFEETSALGGAKFVRGVPTNRYYGKRKVLGNLELRSRLARFRLWSDQYEVGLTGFVDGGRVWADILPRPDLDGTALSLKFGVGGGIRLQKGETFMLRADIAWSPDARPIGAYLLAGHQF
jgi:outer membrane protein assembly factor BamA